jgi:hypothetical protein
MPMGASSVSCSLTLIPLYIMICFFLYIIYCFLYHIHMYIKFFFISYVLVYYYCNSCLLLVLYGYVVDEASMMQVI